MTTEIGFMVVPKDLCNRPSDQSSYTVTDDTGLKGIKLHKFNKYLSVTSIGVESNLGKL